MAAHRTLAIFPTHNESGYSLAHAIQVEAERLGFNTKIYQNSTQETLARACVFDDYIVFDGSVEDVDNYAAAVELVKSLPYVFVVSRTYLPINFQGVDPDGAPNYPNKSSNSQILTWIRKQLSKVIDTPIRPKPKSFNFTSALSLYTNIPNLETSDVFISYRGPLVKTVESLAQQVEAGQYNNIGSKIVKIFQPAPRSFHQTTMTAFDRWSVLAIISDAIITTKEVWIYDSTDTCEYLKSWWTIGELFVCAYRNHPLRRYDPTNGKLAPPLQRHLIQLTEYHKGRLSKLFTNSHPNMIAPESVRRIQNSWLLRRLPFYNDVIFSKAFTDLYVMQCDQCVNWEMLLDPNVFLNIESLLNNSIPGFYSVSLEQMRNKYISCPRCQQSYRIQNKHSYLLWIPSDLISRRRGYVLKRPMFELVAQ